MTSRRCVPPRALRRTPRVRIRFVPDAARRRAVAGAVCVLAVAVALVLPSSARAGWPLAEPASVALGFGSTYSAADGTVSTHRGVDLVAEEGSTVRSPLAGTVSFAGRVPGSGGGTVLAVTISTSSGSVTLMPLASTAVRAGAEVAEGDAVGELAGGGDSSSAGAHLHVGARKGDLYVDPLSLMAPPAPRRPTRRRSRRRARRPSQRRRASRRRPRW